MDMILSHANQPFTDVRVSAILIFNAIASQKWGQHMINNHPGFVEYLLNRDTESTKEGKEAKFEVVRTLVKSETAPEVFDAPVFIRFRHYLKEGPFYQKTEAAVAMEEAS